MAESFLSQAHFHNEEAAYSFVEACIWPRGPVCPHCGGTERNSKMGGKSTRIGAYKCYDCRKPFTVKIGTIFESSHIPMRLWLQAIFLIASSKKGISSNQLHRTLGVTLKSAWFMSHRIREAMKDSGGSDLLGGGGIPVEVDETYFGTARPKPSNFRGFGHKHKIVALVERGGNVRAFHVEKITGDNIKQMLRSNIAKDAHLMTDEATMYRKIGREFAQHSAVHHAKKEYARGEVTTNTVEGYFSILKRGLIGTYHHVSGAHLQRYVAEFDFRYNNRKSVGVDDQQRADNLLRGVKGKRLTYETTVH